MPSTYQMILMCRVANLRDKQPYLDSTAYASECLSLVSSFLEDLSERPAKDLPDARKCAQILVKGLVGKSLH